ncbi:MAG: ADP-ribosylation factor-like protein [Candidatus Thorarchaeota archaeon]
MIHNVLLIDKLDGGIVVRARFWKIDFTDSDIQEFLVGYRDLFTTVGLSEDTPVFVGTHKVFHGLVGEDLLLLFITDGRDEDRVIQHKIREGASRVTTALRGNSIGYIKDNLEDVLGELIFTRFKISFVGSGGVGKSTLLRLLFGKEPAPGGYVPTINVAVDSSETIQFGTFLVTIWDFAGQAVFQDLWGFYFSGTDVIFLVTDSSFRNVMQTKTLLRNIRKEAPAVPLFIITNKQDLPESMKSDKIKRLLGAPTFSMVATDKTRREEFIRFMLEVAAKTVGVDLPDRPISEMITVRRKTEEVEGVRPEDTPGTPGSGFEDVPYQESDAGSVSPTGNPTGSATAVTKTTTAKGAEDQSETSELIATQVAQESKILNVLLIVQKDGLFDVAFNLDYADQDVDVTAITSLISALDSFGGIDEVSPDDETRTDALETIEHEGNLVIIEKSHHFLLALMVSNDTAEKEQRKLMGSLLVEIEQKYTDIWATWDGNNSVFETSVFNILTKIPLMPISFDYIVRAREAGKPLPFANRDVGKAVVEVKTGISASSTIGSLVRTIDLPRDEVLGCLQVMNKFGWVDFRVEIGPASILKKVKEVDEDTIKTYGPVIVQFVNFCDGATALEDVVRKVKTSLAAMKFVATKLVLGGVIEIIA